MEVDDPLAPSSSTPLHGHIDQNQGNGHSGTLKRSNSAPMINVLVAVTSCSEVSPTDFHPLDSQRSRRFSSSSMNVHANTTPIKIPDRINQLKQEEIHIADRETAREREVRSAIDISTSWDGFTLNDYENHEPMHEHAGRRPRSFSETLHIFTSPNILCGAPSPTRVGPGKQCFSPSMQAPVKVSTFTPSPSPSPTRKTFVRSLSPIVGKPSLGKRKLETDGNGFDSYMSPPKKFNTGPSTPDRLIPHPLAHSVSSSSLEESSPEQTVPRTLTEMQEMRISSRPQPHMYGFRPLRDSQDMQTTDSETSDITESTDMSESTDNSSGMIHSTTGSPGDTFSGLKQPPL